jgi:hypothetical protein
MKTINDQISPHEARVFLTLKKTDRWLTNSEIAQRARVALRTARHHSAQLTRLGIAEVAACFPGYQYRLTGRGDIVYRARLEAACAIYGLSSGRVARIPGGVMNHAMRH